MGSVLTYSDLSESFDVWGDWSNTGFKRLGYGWVGWDYNYLDGSVPLTATNIMETDPTAPNAQSPYSELLEFLQSDPSLQYRRDDTLFPFYYDWRLAVEKISGQLVQKIKEVRAKTKEEVILISHSLGCIVARHALISRNYEGNLHLSSQEVAGLIEMAPPIRGASVAFGATQYPEKFLDVRPMLGWFSRIPFVYNRLVRGFKKDVNSFESVFELFPPDTDLILKDEAGKDYSALEWPGWGSASPRVRVNARAARDFHRNGSVVAAPHPQGVQVHILYYNEADTDYFYEFELGSSYPVKRDALPPLGHGDTRVVEASCCYNYNEQGVHCQLIRRKANEPWRDNPHYWLPAMEETKEWLRMKIPNLP